MPGTREGHGRRWALAGAALALLTLSACSSGGFGGDAESAASDYDAGGGVVSEDSAARGGAPESAPEVQDGTVNRTTVQTRAVIRRGEISILTKELNRARTEIDDLLASVGGYLASEDTVNDRAGRPELSVLVLRVPEPAFDETMSTLAGIGRTERTDRSSKDVTTEVIDVDTRVATQEASLARLQRLLRQARTVEDMIRIESEIATRQAELESLKAQQKYLSDQTSMSTVTVRLRTPAAPPPPAPKDDSGFLAGLSDGWAALTAVLVGAATVAGALLPFVVTVAVIGVPMWLLVRALRRRRAEEQLTPPAPTPDAG